MTAMTTQVASARSDTRAEPSPSPRVAIIGTGTMGAAMARNLLHAELAVEVWNRTPERARPLTDAGAGVHATPAQAVAMADVVLTMLPDARTRPLGHGR